MTQVEPSLEEIEEAVVDLLRKEEIATLAVLDGQGAPSVSTMHIAADRLRVYVLTSTHSRKRSEMVEDARVGYVVNHVLPGTGDGRCETLSLQVKGRVTLVESPGEIEWAVRLSREQFPWAADSGMFDHAGGSEGGQKVFFRVDPVEAVWTDHRVGPRWRTVLDCTDDGRRLSGMRPYAELFPARG
ncbi:pyridoxamine 5'-phosphate oxidase family protein [Streptomyces sp. NPDC058464]|uniref:pyridoxamine 5'-phosphate oxidase family protein n=1 Tax=Streptomyces sp. NPDC058464 TaxID=3346511 RepID=UPI00365E967A